MHDRTDADLLAAVADGDRDALRELHDRHVVWVRLRLTRRCSDVDVVNEALQDTFVAVWRGAAKWNGRHSKCRRRADSADDHSSAADC